MSMLPEYLSSRLAPALAIGLALILAACASEPVNFHTLVPSYGAPAAAQTPGMDIRLEPVAVPAQVDRTQIVIRQGRSGLWVLETEWWGAPLVDEIHSALQYQLNPPPGSPPTQPKASLWVDVQRFDSVLGEYALLDVKWRLKPLGSGAETHCHTVLKTPAGDALETLVNAHQTNLITLAALVVEASRGRLRSCAGGGG